MRIAVIGGTGAMGGVWAGRLAAAGHDVLIVGSTQTTIDLINRDGIVVTQPDGTLRVSRIPATANPSAGEPYDALIFFTKAHQTRAAAETALPLVGPRTTIVSLQNGWGNSETLASFYAPEQIVMGITYHGATLLGPGRIAHTSDTGPTLVGPYSGGASLARATAIGDAMTAARLVTTVTAEIKTEIWKKLSVNCAGLPPSALTGLTNGAVIKNAALLGLAEALIREAVAVGRAMGFALDPEERIEAIRRILRNAGDGKSSMLQDIEARRKTEIDVINGAIMREAEAWGIDAPLNRAMVTLIRALESSWTS